jgi:ABC-type proline/glycine betaine transport system ATPase subunit
LRCSARPAAQTTLRGSWPLRTPEEGASCSTADIGPCRRTCGGQHDQSWHVFTLTVAGNVAFGLQEGCRARRSPRVEEMLALVKLDGYGARKPHQLSGGGASASRSPRLVKHPRVLLDEPRPRPTRSCAPRRSSS